MTPTKRKRLYLEDERPLPGDIIEFATSRDLFKDPRRTGRFLRATARAGELALVIAVCEERFLDWMLLLTLRDSKLGWIENKQVVTLCR